MKKWKRNKFLIFFFQLIIILSLIRCKDVSKEGPLAVVIKLIDSEENLDFEEARKYIDLNSVYGSLTNGDNSSHDDIWKEFLETKYNVGKMKKFSNKFKYRNFIIIESIKSNEFAEVSFSAKNKGAKIQKILYELAIMDASWKVIKIGYVKK